MTQRLKLVLIGEFWRVYDSVCVDGRQFCFVHLPRALEGVDNDFAERLIRPAVLRRKNGRNNRPEHGTAVQSILMSVHRTLLLRGHIPMQTIVAALRIYIATRTLPPLPA